MHELKTMEKGEIVGFHLTVILNLQFRLFC